MPRMRQRARVCSTCMLAVAVEANLDEGVITAVHLPPQCTHPHDCQTRLSYDILDRPYSEGTHNEHR